MSTLRPSEKVSFETLFGMASGYVLNFSDAKFSEFFKEVLGLDIDSRKYLIFGTSKAKRLRAFWNLETDAVVGKAMKEMVALWEATTTGTETFLAQKIIFERCNSLVSRLLNENVSSARAPEKVDVEIENSFGQKLAELKTEFLNLQAMVNRNEAGLRFEKLLNRLFTLFGLEPNGAFRITGEQIDGSFALDREIYLLEAKWTQGPIGEADLLIFRQKVESKSSFTRGLFLSVNGFSGQAIDAIVQGKQPNFVMMDGSDLFRVLDGHIRFEEMLWMKVRFLGERGKPYTPITELIRELG